MAISSLLPSLRASDRDTLIQRITVLAFLGLFLVFFALPVAALLYRSFTGEDGGFVGFDNYASYVATSGFRASVVNSLTVGVLTTFFALLLGFPFAYGLVRTCMPLRGLFRTLSMLPLLAPPMLFAISTRFLFNSQGPLNWVLGGQSIYGLAGIVMGEVFYAFPPVVLILMTGLATVDGRLIEVARSSGASNRRIFTTVTLPAAKYALASAAIVAFIQSITDFGIPKIIGGQYNVLATDIYKQVVGQMNFAMGAVVSVMMLLPAIICFLLDRKIRSSQFSTLSSQSVPHVPRPNTRFDRAMFAYCATISFAIVAFIAFAAYISLVTYWPYDLVLTLAHYDFGAVDPRSAGAFVNSLYISMASMFLGTIAAWSCAYFQTVTRNYLPSSLLDPLAVLPLSVPGLVLGLSYIVFFIHPANPLNGLYGSFALLVVSIVIHHFTIGYTISTVGLAQIDNEIHSIGACMGVPFYTTLRRVIVPVSLPVIFEVASYYFIVGMTTTSTVIFLYTPETIPASVSILHLDENGNLASAAALSVVVFLTCLAVRCAQVVLCNGVLGRTQRWRNARSHVAGS